MTDQPTTPEPATTAPESCLRCGSNDIGEGYILNDRPVLHRTRFATRALGLLRARRLFRLSRFTLQIQAKVCRTCGYLMMDVDPEKLQRVEKRFSA